MDVDTLNDIALVGIPINHFQHGAPLQVFKDDTAFPWRGSAILSEFQFDQGAARDAVHLLLKEAGVQLQGYYAYLNPSVMPNWRSWYWDDHYTMLSEIRGDYDPLDIFGKPSTIESIVETNPIEEATPINETTTGATPTSAPSSSASKSFANLIPACVAAISIVVLF